MPEQKHRIVKVDFRELTYGQLAQMLVAIWYEIKARNPIGVNSYYNNYVGFLGCLREMEKAEGKHWTSECGPKRRVVELQTVEHGS